jgi:RNA polymerase sigma-70 factor (ECF subfamily)
MQSQFDDIRTMERVAAHDQQALLALYQEYGRAVYSLAYRILQNSTLAEEVTQDTFLKVWQRAQWDPNKGKLKNWLLAITHFTAVDRLRQEKRQPALDPSSIDDMEAEMLGARSEAGGWQDGTLLRMLVSQLPPDQASLIDLAFFSGLSHSEIAEVTHIPLGTVKTRLRAGIQRLRELWIESSKQTSN